MGLGQKNGAVKVGVPTAGFRYCSLTNYQDKPVKAGIPREEERSSYDQHPCPRSTPVVEVTAHVCDMRIGVGAHRPRRTARSPDTTSVGSVGRIGQGVHQIVQLRRA